MVCVGDAAPKSVAFAIGMASVLVVAQPAGAAAVDACLMGLVVLDCATGGMLDDPPWPAHEAVSSPAATATAASFCMGVSSSLPAYEARAQGDIPKIE
jgi:hypothetical protein